MYLTEKEIFSEYAVMEKTIARMEENQDALRALYRNAGAGRIAFIGCGSSYSLAKSAALAARLYAGADACAYAAGDLLLRFDEYAPQLAGSLLVPLSRSGSTSEVLLVIERATKELGIPCLSLCAVEGSPLEPLASLTIALPWAFDESVCQTRCVANLYLASMQLSGILGGDAQLLADLKDAAASGVAFQREYAPVLSKIAGRDWDNVIVLAGGEVAGLAEEGALAFIEISLLRSHYYHLLDVRHGPMVLIDNKTLVVALLSPGENAYQDGLLADIRAKGATLVAVGDQAGNDSADLYVRVPERKRYAAYGVPFIFVPQALAFHKALARRINPDTPAGLDPWIKL